MKRIFVPTRSGSDWQPLLAEPIKHWKKGKSAMTAAACWEAAGTTFPPEIATSLDKSGDADLMSLKLLAAIPEWTVPLKGGDTASQTDVLALASNEGGLCVVAVEAKVDEDFGPTLKQKRAEASTGQSDRLDELHRLLGVASLPDALRYQLVHRTASAILTAREFYAHAAVMLVHSFGKRPSLREDFDAFGRAVGAHALNADVKVVPTLKTPRLFLAWCGGDSGFLDVQLPTNPMIIDDVLKAHRQLDTYSCIPMAVELVLKLLGRVPLDYIDEQVAWGNRSDGNFASYDGKELKGVKFKVEFPLGSYPRSPTFPLDRLFATIDSELAASRYVAISLSAPGGWHNYVICNARHDGEYEAITKGRTPELITDVRQRITAMQGTDILTYQIV